MPARDDAGSNYGRPGGSQNSGVNNGGVAGGMGGGFGGGGAGRMGGIGSRTGLTTGNTMFGGMAFGRPGGFAMNPGAFGVRPQAGIAQGPLSGARPRPAAVAGVNPVPENIPALEDVPMPPATPNVFNQNYLGSLADFRTMMNNRYGWGAAQPGPGPMPAPAPTGVSPPNALDNDISTLMDHTNRNPRQLGGMAGGMGVPGYASPGTNGYGGGYSGGYNPGSRGPGQRGW